MTGRLMAVGFIVLGALGGCSSQGDVAKEDPVEVPPEVVFERFYVNHAWAYQLRGAYITAEGDVYTYTRTGDEWRPTVYREAETPPESPEEAMAFDFRDHSLDRADLVAKFTDPVAAGKVDADSVMAMARLLPHALEGPYSAEQAMYDAGEFYWVGYLLDPETDRCRRVTLKASGDVEMVNGSDAAARIVSWLESVLPE